MYKRNAQGWSKHIDFIILDLFVLVIAFGLAVLLKNYDAIVGLESVATLFGTTIIDMPMYRILLFVFILADLVIIIFLNIMHDVIRRGYLLEFIASSKLVISVFLIVTAFMFVTRSGAVYSRMTLYLTSLLHFLLGYVSRVIYKKILIRGGALERFNGNKRSMLAVVRKGNAEDIVKRLQQNPAEGFHLVALAMDGAGSGADGDCKEICGVPVVADLEGVSEYICRQWIDSVYIDCPSEDRRVQKVMDDCREMAVPVHYHIPGVSQHDEKQFTERIGGTTVLTLSMNYATPLQLFIKRAGDLVGGAVGSIAALIIIMIIGPVIKISSPGPVLYSSDRIGQNGKRFKMYKIRSMVMDADDRKSELMDKNRIKDGMMFKLDWDPRIIGNRELPDGRRKSGIGEFIRKTSLDEFPQFFNVLKGDMSLVGTRPPTPDEWDKYEFHHRARLATKPGITGMWQISGRSDIQDFEEVVKLDTEYIQNWSFALDLRILFKTVLVVLTGKGAM